MEVSSKHINWLGLDKPVFAQKIAEGKAMCSRQFCLTNQKKKKSTQLCHIQIPLFFRFENNERDFVLVSSANFHFV